MVKLEDVKLLQSLGYEVPEIAVAYIENKELQEKGIVQVWGCNRCDNRYETAIKLQAINHLCVGLKSPAPRPLSVVWEAKEGPA